MIEIQVKLILAKPIVKIKLQSNGSPWKYIKLSSVETGHLAGAGYSTWFLAPILATYSPLTWDCGNSSTYGEVLLHTKYAYIQISPWISYYQMWWHFIFCGLTSLWKILCFYIHCNLFLVCMEQKADMRADQDWQQNSALSTMHIFLLWPEVGFYGCGASHPPSGQLGSWNKNSGWPVSIVTGILFWNVDLMYFKNFVDLYPDFFLSGGTRRGLYCSFLHFIHTIMS